MYIPYIIHIIRCARGPKSKKWYTIFGDVYVHELMDGEALKLPDGTEGELGEILLI